MMATIRHPAIGLVDDLVMRTTDNVCRNSIAIGSSVSTVQDYELVIGGLVKDEIRVVMTPEEHAVVSRLLMRAVSDGR